MSFNLDQYIIGRESGFVSGEQFQNRLITYRSTNLRLSRLKAIGIKGGGDGIDPVSIHSAGVLCLDLEKQDLRYLLAGAGDGTLYIHDTANFSGKPEHRSTLIAKIGKDRGNHSKRAGHTGAVHTCEWYADDNGLFITSGWDGKIKVWDANELEVAEEFKMAREPVYCHSVNGRNGLIAVASASNHLNLVDLRSGSGSHEIRGHAGSVLTCKWSPFDDHILASGDKNGRLGLWDVRRAKNSLIWFDFDRTKSTSKVSKSAISHKGSINALAFLDDGKSLLSYGGQDARLRKWDYREGINCKTRFPRFVPNPKYEVCLQIDTTFLAGDSFTFLPSEDSIYVLNNETGDKVSMLNGHFFNVFCCIFNNVTQELISGGCDRNILLWHSNHSEVDAYQAHISESGVRKNGNIDVYQDCWSSSSDEDS